MNKQTNELKHIVEAAILVSDDPISINRIISLFPDSAKPEKKQVQTAIDELMVDCEQRGIELKKVGSGFRFQSKERYAEFLRKLYELKPPRYSRAVLETLSIIAYRQPVTRGDIEDVRGVSVSTEIMRTLLNRQWVREVGFKEVPGRPVLYATTKEFLAYFNLKTIREMPELQQKRELDEIAKDNQISLPLIEPQAQVQEHDEMDGGDSLDIASQTIDTGNDALTADDVTAADQQVEVSDNVDSIEPESESTVAEVEEFKKASA